MDYYGSISSGYDELHSEEQREKARLIMQNCPIGGLLLDVGAGTGSSTGLFSGKAECIALDPSLEMLKRFKGLKVAARAERLPFKNKSFDCVVSITALHHADLGKAKAELERVAKENASIAVSFFKRAQNFGPAKRLFSSFRQIDSEKDLVFARP